MQQNSELFSLKGDPKYIEERRAVLKKSRRCCLLFEKGFTVRNSVADSDPHIFLGSESPSKSKADTDLQAKLKLRHYEGSKWW
jgi:hypothetical protein